MSAVERETYGLAVAACTDRIIAAVHDRQPDLVLDELAAVLNLTPPAGVDPVTAVVSVLAAQVPPPWALPLEMRLGWVAADGMTAGEGDR